VRSDGLKASVSGCGIAATLVSRFCERVPAILCAMPVRVLVFALVLQIVLAAAFAIWAASGFPLP
jgi:hypothetical protein